MWLDSRAPHVVGQSCRPMRREVQDLPVWMQSAGGEGRPWPKAVALSPQTGCRRMTSGWAAVSQDKAAALAENGCVCGQAVLPCLNGAALHSTVGLSFTAIRCSLLVMWDDQHLSLASGTACLLLGDMLPPAAVHKPESNLRCVVQCSSFVRCQMAGL